MFRHVTEQNLLPNSLGNKNQWQYSIGEGPSMDLTNQNIASKTLAYERSQGGFYGAPLPQYNNVSEQDLLSKYMTPDINALPLELKQRAFDFNVNSENPLGALMEATGTLTPENKSKLYIGGKLDEPSINNLWKNTGQDAYQNAYNSNPEGVIDAFDAAKLRSYQNTNNYNQGGKETWEPRNAMWGGPQISATPPPNAMPPMPYDMNQLMPPVLQQPQQQVQQPPIMGQPILPPTDTSTILPTSMEDINAVKGIEKALGDATVNPITEPLPGSVPNVGKGSMSMDQKMGIGAMGLGAVSALGQGLMPDRYNQRTGSVEPGAGRFLDTQFTQMGMALGPVGMGVGFGVDMLKNTIGYAKQKQAANGAERKANFYDSRDSMKTSLLPDFTGLS